MPDKGSGVDYNAAMIAFAFFFSLLGAPTPCSQRL
jgi:hypothetical protein